MAQPLSEQTLQELLADERVASRLACVKAEIGASIWRFCAMLFALANGSIRFNSLVTELTRQSSGESSARLSISDVGEPFDKVSTDEHAIRGELLRSLWEAVNALPREQRLALLLNLNGPEGLGAWSRHGVVSPTGLAAAAEVSPERLNSLPLSDFEIADHLGLQETDPVKKRQKVINLRRSARRQLAGYFESS